MDKNIKKLEEDLDNFNAVKYRMREEGIGYCFDGYSDWDEIEDEEFHKLRKLYIDVSKKLEEYVNKKYTESIWEVDYDDEDEDDN